MAFTIILGLTILSVANYGNTFEFSGLDPSVQSKTQLKPTIKPVSSFTNQPRLGDQVKPAFAGFKNVAAKPYGLPFDSFKPSYQPYQPGPFRTNYQPFGPYPGYPGPVVYPNQGGFPGPAAYPAPPHHFDDPNQRPFGFQPFPGSPQQPFNPFKFGSAKKFNKNSPGLAEINLPGKYFQEHQFGTYHGPEFSSAIVPAEHNLKQSKPKDTLLGKPAIPALPELGLPKQNVYGFAPPPPSFRYPLPSFPPNQPFFNAVPSVKSSPTTVASPVTTGVDQRSDFGFAAVTTAAAPTSSQDESATAQQSSEVTGEPLSVTPAADPQPTGPSQEEVTAAGVEVATNNEVPATAADYTAAKEQSEQSNPTTEATEPGAADGEKPAITQENDTQTSVEKLSPVVVEELKETSTLAAAGGDFAGKLGEILQGIKPTEPAAAANVPGLPNELYSPVGDVPVSVQPYLGASGYPFNFGQTADFPAQPSFFANYEPPKFTEEDLKKFEESFKNGDLQSFQFIGGSDAAVKIAGDAAAGVIVSTESGASAVSSSTPSSNEEKAQSGASPADAVGEEKKEAGQSESRNTPAEDAPKKSNTVQIIQDDPFNGQFPLLFDPSNTAAAASPLDTYRFYSHPTVSALSSQASLASYSPEDAFANFGTQFRQAYLVEGSPSLTPPAVTKTVVHTSQIPISISSADHPLHSQVFRFSQSFVPYPEAVASNGVGAAAFRSFEAQPSSSTVVTPVGVGNSDVSSSTATADAVVSSTTETAAVPETGSSTETSS